MSLSRNSSFFKQYAKSGYFSKINPQFDGIARKYYDEKKRHDKVHSLKNKLDKEVAYLERMEKKMENQLSKKGDQLKFTREVNHRLANEIQKREWLHQYREISIKKNTEKTNQLKSQSMKRLKEAKEYMFQQKRSLADSNRSENRKIKEIRTLKKAKEWDANRSKASELYQFKKNVKESNNKFYQSRNDQSMKSYESRIKSYRKYAQSDTQKVKQLEDRLRKLNQKLTSDKVKADEINDQIQKIKRQSKMENSLLRSRLRSRSSASIYSTGNHLQTQLNEFLSKDGL